MAFKLYGRGVTPAGDDYTVDTIGRLYGTTEETGCETCGMPLYLGDRALMVENGDVFCGSACMDRSYCIGGRSNRLGDTVRQP